ncbi:MAG TPA: energy transducer TonB [Vicinamibacteria bacterium]
MTGAPALLIGLLLVAAAEDPAPARVGGFIAEPRKLKNVDPRYPPDALRAGLAGHVVLECLVDTRGQVVTVDVLHGVPPLAGAAVTAVKKWQYTPTLVDGRPTPVIMTVTVRFNLGAHVLTYHGLLGSLDHREEAVREAASLHLGNLVGQSGIGQGDVRKAIRALEPLAASDPSPQVRAAAARSLSRLGARPLPEGVAGAPLPERSAVAWGEFVNPSGQSTIRAGEDRVVISVPAGQRDLAVESGPVLAPRLVKRIGGDFDALVTVDTLPEPGPPVGQGSFRGAGILLWQDERNYVRLESATYRLRPAPAGTRLAPYDVARRDLFPGPVGRLRTDDVRYALLEVRRDGRPLGGPSPADVRLEDGPAELRMERRERTIRGFVRQRGGEWRRVGEVEVDLVDSLEVGLAAVNVAATALHAGFRAFSTSQAGELTRHLAPARPSAAGSSQDAGVEVPPELHDSPPRPLHVTRPQYPAEARARNLEGTVVVELLIDADGRVTRSRVMQSVPGLDEAALACVQTWRFAPAVKNGQRVPTLAHAPIAFRLD